MKEHLHSDAMKIFRSIFEYRILSSKVHIELQGEPYFYRDFRRLKMRTILNKIEQLKRINKTKNKLKSIPSVH